MNAFSSGTRRKNAAVAVSTGALAELDREQLQGVAAHEVAHIVDGDVPVRTVAFAILQAFASLVAALKATVAFLFFQSYRYRQGVVAMLWLVVLVPAWLVLGVSHLAVRGLYHASSRASERRADATAVELTRNPMGLARAIAGTMWGNRGIVPRGDPLAPLLFSPSAPRTHPAPEERIEALTGSRPTRTPDGDLVVGGTVVRNPRPLSIRSRARPVRARP